MPYPWESEPIPESGPPSTTEDPGVRDVADFAERFAGGRSTDPRVQDILNRRRQMEQYLDAQRRAGEYWARMAPWRRLAETAQGPIMGQARQGLAQAAQAQRSGLTSMGATIGTPLAEQAVSGGAARVRQAEAQGMNEINSAEEIARRALLGQIAQAALASELGGEGADAQARIAEMGLQSQIGVQNQELLARLLGGFVSGGTGAA